MKKLFSLFLCLVLLFGLLPMTTPARAATALAVSSVKADKTSANVGATVTWTATASGGSGTLKYYFNVYKDGTKVASRAYSAANTFSSTPAEPGTNQVRVYVKDAAGAKVNKLSSAVTAAPLALSSVKADKTSVSVGAAVTWTASASGGTGTLKYYFILYKDGSRIATRSYSTAKTFSYIPTEPGTYKVRVYVKDADDTKISKLSGAVTVTSKASLYVSSCIYITSKEPSSSVYVNGRVVDYYNGYLDGAAMNDLALDSAPKKTGFAAYSKSSSGIYTLHFLPAGNGDATGVRTVTLNDNASIADEMDCILLNGKLYLRDGSGEWQALDLSNVRVMMVGNAAAITTISITSTDELFNYVRVGLKITITLVENVVGGVHSVGGGAIYITEINS